MFCSVTLVVVVLAYTCWWRCGRNAGVDAGGGDDGDADEDVGRNPGVDAGGGG